MTISRSLLFLFGISLLFSCNGGASGDRTRAPRQAVKAEPKLLELLEPSLNDKLTSGQDFKVNLAWVDTVASIDSLELFFDTARLTVLKDGKLTYVVSTREVHPGTRRLRAVAHFSTGKKEVHTTEIVLVSDKIPQRYTYRVLKEYPHDTGAYTQGFEYYKGFLFEGTGQHGQSSLRKTELSTGQILKARTLSAEFFGEGITIMNNKVYQVTYRTQVGFVYDVETFEELQKIYYQNKEGWGLANNGTDIIMSDGTHQIYFMDPKYFSVNRKIEVMDHNGRVDSLNELEWINGKIWANVYLTDDIVIIDPESGRVEGRVDLSGILKPEDRNARVDVLNGIAWDKENNRLFVTGKYWPKTFEIEVIKI